MSMCIDHINIVVADIERSAKFYTELLGFEIKGTRTLSGEWIDFVSGLSGVNAEVVFLELAGGQGPRVELLCYNTPDGESVCENSFPNTKGLRHIAFCVEDIDAMYEKLSAQGIEFVCPPTGVNAGKISGIPAGKSLCYFHDPDGVLLEICAYQG